jgi:hypothetical protein
LDPSLNRLPCLLREFEPDGLRCFLLHDSRPAYRATLAGDILHPQTNKIAAPKFAIDRQVEQREILWPTGKLEPNPDRPDLRQLQRRFLTDESPLVPRHVTRGAGLDMESIFE